MTFIDGIDGAILLNTAVGFGIEALSARFELLMWRLRILEEHSYVCCTDIEKASHYSSIQAMCQCSQYGPLCLFKFKTKKQCL